MYTLLSWDMKASILFGLSPMIVRSPTLPWTRRYRELLAIFVATTCQHT
jgi:hypothetical protein